MKIKRGSKVIVQVPRNADVATVKRLGIEKHAYLNQYFCSLEEYVLFYPDFKVIVDLPNRTEKFSLEKYKGFLMKPYQRIDFYLCTKNALLSSVNDFSDFYAEDNSVAGNNPEVGFPETCIFDQPAEADYLVKIRATRNN